MALDEAESAGATSQEAVPTAPTNWVTSLHGLDEEQARSLASCIGAYVRGLSCHLDMRNLDGITIAYDYDAALQNLDRGFETSQRSTRSNGEAVGVAMTTSVMREGQAKSHMLFGAHYILPILDEAHEHYAGALHTLAHECAHVEVASRLHAAFPGQLIYGRFQSRYAAHRRSAVQTCWEEYEVTARCAGFGGDPTEAYETIFLERLAAADDAMHAVLVACSESLDWDALALGALTVFSDLFRAASYLLGTMSGYSRQISDLPRLAATLDDHWFAPYVEELREACEAVSTEYGRWTDWSSFDAIGDLIEQAITQAGVEVTDVGNSMYRVRPV